MNEGPAVRHILTLVDQKTGRAPRREGASYKARCPAHDDHDPSLSITPIEGSVLLHCHAGCAVEDILAALQLASKDLYDDPKGVTYRYDSGRVVHRSPTKKFRQSGNTEVVELYHLARLKAAGPGSVFLVEGEKDVHAIEAAGGVATSAPMGAANVDKADMTPLLGRHVLAVVDNDTAGTRWAETVARLLTGVVAGLRFVRARTGKDAADHIAAGHDLNDFEPLPDPLVDYVAPASPEGEPTERQLIAIAASSLHMRSPTWLYDLRIPTGAITLLGGREGIGKSSLSYNMLAALTRGNLPGQYHGQARNVGVVAIEDAWHEVVVPRLHAAGADLGRVMLIQARQDGQPDNPSMPADLGRLEELSAIHELVMVLLDPLMSLIHHTIDTHKDREVRLALDPLARLARTSGMAILGLIHANKSTTTDPLNSLMASRAFSAVARSVLYCIADPDAQRQDRYLFGHVKSNLGPKQPTVGYHLIEAKLDLADGNQLITSRAVWDGSDDRSIQEVMETPRPRATSEPAARILAVIKENAPHPVATADLIAALPDMKRATLDQHLSRLVDRGQLRRPLRGQYALPLRSG